MSNQDISVLLERLDRIEAAITLLGEERAVKDWYTTAEMATLLGKAEFTVREWCRLGRVRAEKQLSGRGAFPAWIVSRDELRRYQREGLLPLRRFS
jgi:Helix-turn-helix domain